MSSLDDRWRPRQPEHQSDDSETFPLWLVVLIAVYAALLLLSLPLGFIDPAMPLLG